jgi:hypothetical protein
MYVLTYAARRNRIARTAAERLVDMGFLLPARVRQDGRELYRLEDMRAAYREWQLNAPTEDYCFICLEWWPAAEVKDGACSRCRTKHSRAATLAEAEERRKSDGSRR